MKPRRRPALLHRYFFYGWLFRDASAGSYLERAAALAHNRVQSRWLPRYLMRWLFISACCLALARYCEFGLANRRLAAMFYVFTTLSVIFNVVTAACWRVLRAGARQRR